MLKKILCVLLLVAFVVPISFMVTACGGGTVHGGEDDNINTDNPTPQPTVLSVPDISVTEGVASISITWARVDGASKYEVFWNGVDVSNKIQFADSSQLFWIPSLQRVPSSVNTLRMWAHSPFGDAYHSPELTRTFDLRGQLNNAMLHNIIIPDNLEDSSNPSITVQWNPVADASYYRIILNNALQEVIAPADIEYFTAIVFLTQNASNNVLIIAVSPRAEEYNSILNVTSRLNVGALDLRRSLVEPATTTIDEVECCDENDFMRVITISWSSVEGAVNYSIVKTFGGITRVLPVPSGQLTHSIMISRIAYSIAIRAYSPHGFGFNSTSETVDIPPYVATRVLEIPVVEFLPNNVAIVSWTLTGAVRYRIDIDNSQTVIYLSRITDDYGNYIVGTTNIMDTNNQHFNISVYTNAVIVRNNDDTYTIEVTINNSMICRYTKIDFVRLTASFIGETPSEATWTCHVTNPVTNP